MNMNKYSVEQILRNLSFTWVQIEEMSEQEIQQELVENNFRYCEGCFEYVHTDDYNGEPELCDECI